MRSQFHNSDRISVLSIITIKNLFLSKMFNTLITSQISNIFLLYTKVLENSENYSIFATK